MLLLLPVFSSYEKFCSYDPVRDKLVYCGEGRMVYIPFRERMYLDYLLDRWAESINKLDHVAFDYWDDRFLSYGRRIGLYEYPERDERMV